MKIDKREEINRQLAKEIIMQIVIIIEGSEP